VKRQGGNDVTETEMTADTAGQETLLSRVIERGGRDTETLSDLHRTALEQNPGWRPDVPEVWPTLSKNPSGEHMEQWRIGVCWSAAEILRLARGEGRPKGMGGDTWTDEPGAVHMAKAQWKELAKSISLLDNPPRLLPAATTETLLSDPMTQDLGHWDIPRGLSVTWDKEDGVCWCGKTDKLVWNPDPTSGTWLWLNRNIEDGFLFRQKFRTLYLGGERGGLLIIAFCAAALDAATSWEHASGPTMGDYYNYFDSYHLSVARARSGYCNLRRCGPGLILLANGEDPSREENRWYETVILKSGGVIDLYVDGALANSYLDCGHITPRLDKGRIGLRHVQVYEGQHRDVCVEKIARPD